MLFYSQICLSTSARARRRRALDWKRAMDKMRGMCLHLPKTNIGKTFVTARFEEFGKFGGS